MAFRSWLGVKHQVFIYLFVCVQKTPMRSASWSRFWRIAWWCRRMSIAQWSRSSGSSGFSYVISRSAWKSGLQISSASSGPSSLRWRCGRTRESMCIFFYAGLAVDHSRTVKLNSSFAHYHLHFLFENWFCLAWLNYLCMTIRWLVVPGCVVFLLVVYSLSVLSLSHQLCSLFVSFLSDVCVWSVLLLVYTLPSQ